MLASHTGLSPYANTAISDPSDGAVPILEDTHNVDRGSGAPSRSSSSQRAWSGSHLADKHARGRTVLCPFLSRWCSVAQSNCAKSSTDAAGLEAGGLYQKVGGRQRMPAVCCMLHRSGQNSQPRFLHSWAWQKGVYQPEGKSPQSRCAHLSGRCDDASRRVSLYSHRELH